MTKIIQGIDVHTPIVVAEQQDSKTRWLSERVLALQQALERENAWNVENQKTAERYREKMKFWHRESETWRNEINQFLATLGIGDRV